MSSDQVSTSGSANQRLSQQRKAAERASMVAATTCRYAEAGRCEHAARLCACAERASREILCRRKSVRLSALIDPLQSTSCNGMSAASNVNGPRKQHTSILVVRTRRVRQNSWRRLDAADPASNTQTACDTNQSLTFACITGLSGCCCCPRSGIPV